MAKTFPVPLILIDSSQTLYITCIRSGMKPTDRNPVTRPGTVTKISIMDCKTIMYLTLFILGLYYEVLNIHYPTKRNFRSDLLLFFKLRFIVSRGMKPTDNPFSGFLKIIL